MASYPGTLKAFTPKVDVVDRVMGEHPNSLQDEVVAVETILGINPQISSFSDPLALVRLAPFSFATVDDRISNLENGIVGDVHSQYIHKSGGDTIWPVDTSRVGLTLRKYTGSTLDLLRFVDTDGTTVKGSLDSDFRLTVQALTVLSGGAIFNGGANFTGEVSAPSLYLAGTNPATVPLIIKLASAQSADALQVRPATSNTPSVRIDANGGLYVTDLTVNGHLTSGNNTSSSVLDLSGVTGAATAIGTGTGDKVSLHANYGLGVQTNALVAYVPAGGGLVVRGKAGSGEASSGADGVVLAASGAITARSLAVDGSLTAGPSTLGATSITSLSVTGTLNVAATLTAAVSTLNTVTWTQATSLQKLEVRSTSATGTGLIFTDTTPTSSGSGGDPLHPVLRLGRDATKIVKAEYGELRVLNLAQGVLTRVDDSGNFWAASAITGDTLNAPGFVVGYGGGMELGNHLGPSYLDFRHSTAPDFDARIMGIGNSLGVNGGGNIDVTAANTNFYSNVVLTDHKLYARGSGDANHWLGYATDVDGWKFQSNIGFAWDNLQGGLKRLVTLTNGGMDLGYLPVISGTVISRGNSHAAGRFVGPIDGQGHVLNDKSGHAIELVWNAAIDHIDLYVDSQLISSTHRGSRITGGYPKLFVIDHPVDRERYLAHAAVEGPTADVFYRGEIAVGGSGSVRVDLPSYFEAATLAQGRTVQLTPVHRHSGEFAVVQATPVLDGGFTIYASHPSVVFWEVKAVRADVLPYDVEPRKDEVEVNGFGPYLYMKKK